MDDQNNPQNQKYTYQMMMNYTYSVSLLLIGLYLLLDEFLFIYTYVLWEQSKFEIMYGLWCLVWSKNWYAR